MELYYATFPDDETADKVARQVVQERLAACANRLDSRSTYRWDGQVTAESEVVVLFKTGDDAGDALVDRLKDLHPYDTPCIIGLDAAPNAAYAAYVDGETR